MRHRRYNDLTKSVPQLTQLYTERSSLNPDFVYLEDQVKLVRESREITELPLNEKARLALREEQEGKALAIENKRRKAKGEELLTSLDDDKEDDSAEPSHSETDQDGDESTSDQVADTDTQTESEEEKMPDVLLSEAGNVLVDAILMKQQRFAEIEKDT